MRSSADIVLAMFALLALVAVVDAECCSANSDDICGDNTVSTPCCGYGSCNIFCCNCDNGCRTGDYNTCVDRATRDFGPTCPGSCYSIAWSIPVCWSADDCQKYYNNAIAACKAQYGVSRRSLAHPFAGKRQQANPADGYEVFSLVDKDKNGNITLEEYVDYLQFQRPQLKENPHLLVEWFKYFESFDRNGDGVIKIDEHHRITDD